MTDETSPSDTAASAEPPALLCPVPNAGKLFPRAHPSVGLATLLGALALLGLGPIAGVPAILLGGLIQSEIAEAEGRYTGEGQARTAVLLGWTGTLVFGSLFLYLLGARSAWFAMSVIGAGVAAGVAALVGQSWSGAPKPIAAVGEIARRAPVVTCAALGCLVAAGSVGLVSKRGADRLAREEAIARCSQEAWAADQAISLHRFDEARSYLAEAQQVCADSERARVAETLAGLDEKEAAYRQVLAVEEEQQRARLLREEEERLATAFVTSAEEVERRLKLAALKAAQAEWFEADQHLGVAQSALSQFKGSRLEGSARWVHLNAQIAAQRSRIEPGLEQLRKAKEAKERQEAALEEAARKREEAARKREEAQEKAREAREAARAAAQEAAEAARESSSMVMCCDGTTSPSCLCNGSRRGCCSHHGGVCGCN